MEEGAAGADTAADEQQNKGQNAWVITGLVALSDYSTMFSDNNDTMFDALKFGVAVCSPEEFEQYPDKSLIYNYAWKRPGRGPG